MNTYLTIMVTVLVATQLIRITQNAVQLHRQKKVFEKQMEGIEDITNFDIHRQRRVNELVIAYLERKLREMEE